MFEPSKDPKEERVRLLEAVKVAFSDLLGEEEEGLYLQSKSDKWDGQMIDVVDSVCDGAILHLQQTTPVSKVVVITNKEGGDCLGIDRVTGISALTLE